jgi:hypothetical protein
MAWPVVELIAIEVVSRLEEIQLKNGYELDVSQVARPTKTMSKIYPRNNCIWVLQGDSVRIRDMDLPGNPPAIAYRVTFSIACFSRLSDKENEEIDPMATQVAACAHKAIAAPNDWHSFGGNAINAEIGDMERFKSSEGNHQGVMFPLEILYRVSENDPYQARA